MHDDPSVPARPAGAPWRVGLAAALVVAIACAGPDEPATPPARESQGGAPAAARDARRLPTALGTYRVAWAPTPDPVPLGRVFALAVEVTRPDGAPAEDVEVDVDAGMPEHRHGMNLTPAVTRTGPGRFAAQGMLFHMPGRWEIRIDVRRPGDIERAVFEVDVE